ncbi:275R [Invertebrate iridescent virus Kaz2018]|uniref:Uncharacterized protein n=1 Tax=Iridovirus sp. TaxID=135728 RepID=A0AAU7YB89_9VIRU|nr:275R [Invertebrate iridescent virus Kaz2018]
MMLLFNAVTMNSNVCGKFCPLPAGPVPAAPTLAAGLAVGTILILVSLP